MKSKILYSLLSILCLYLLFFPVEIEPIAWHPQSAGEYEGMVSKIKNVHPNAFLNVPGIGPEDIAIDDDDNIYAGLNNGNIIKFDRFGKLTVIGSTGGRPLGLRFHPNGDLIIADAYKGLLAMHKNGEIRILSSEFNGKVFSFIDDLDIDGEGTIYFSDASKYRYDQQTEYVFESAPTGSVYAYNVETNETSLVLDNLHFPNGLALSEDGNYLLIAETLRYRVIKLWLKGENRGSTEIFMDNLPGFPDGILAGQSEGYWIAFASPRNTFLDTISPYPFVRKIVYRLPSILMPGPPDIAFFAKIDSKGNYSDIFYTDSGSYSEVTNVVEKNGKIYLGSISEKSIAVLNL